MDGGGEFKEVHTKNFFLGNEAWDRPKRDQGKSSPYLL